MPRRITYAQGKDEIKKTMDKYGRSMRDKKVRALIDNTLWAVAQKEGPEVANALITQFKLYTPAYGSHEWFDDGNDNLRVLKLDPNFKVPNDWKIFPGDKKHPGEINLKNKKKV